MLNRAGKTKVGCVIWLLLLAASAYAAKEFGGIYLRRLKLEDATQAQAAFAGQIADEAIRQQLLAEVVTMDLPPEARRIMLARTSQPRALRIVIRYTETADLLFTTVQVPISIDVRRSF
ncbi:MAG: hypothetical protein R3246_15420 [Acidimicrobiia bacterium]|nr:hypothetical protein [Acidimicrobiia bacterium]